MSAACPLRICLAHFALRADLLADQPHALLGPVHRNRTGGDHILHRAVGRLDANDDLQAIGARIDQLRAPDRARHSGSLAVGPRICERLPPGLLADSESVASRTVARPTASDSSSATTVSSTTSSADSDQTELAVHTQAANSAIKHARRRQEHAHAELRSESAGTDSSQTARAGEAVVPRRQRHGRPNPRAGNELQYSLVCLKWAKLSKFAASLAMPQIGSSAA